MTFYQSKELPKTDSAKVAEQRIDQVLHDVKYAFIQPLKEALGAWDEWERIAKARSRQIQDLSEHVDELRELLLRARPLVLEAYVGTKDYSPEGTEFLKAIDNATKEEEYVPE